MDDLDNLLIKQRKRISKFDEKLAIEEKKLELALQITKVRQKEGITQSELAELLKTKQSVISRIERGNQNITIDLLYRIAQVLRKNVRLQFV